MNAGDTNGPLTHEKRRDEELYELNAGNDSDAVINRPMDDGRIYLVSWLAIPRKKKKKF